ncbi:ATP-binding cassette domain-containing protein [Chryseobacterium sp.]|uniref:ATP-binding cassette domain-containing protein n=1 Tax=Chryseobacterium sp. TaxID=1871047 RepID=UPI0025BDF284|nr:ATP-binding cassette domain-containing protein [Chryseobacterium sp.]
MDIQIRHQIFSSAGNQLLQVQEHFQQGSLISVSGKSGVGKTTLLKIIAGLIKPDQGKITFGEAVFINTEKKIFIPPQKRNTAIMFQQYVLFPNMNVQQNILYAQKEKDLDIVNELLKSFGLEKFSEILPQKLSGGQQQRVALARTLAQDAGIILLDEPLSAVDEAMSENMKNTILTFQKKNKSTVFVVTHNEADFKEYSDYTLVIE